MFENNNLILQKLEPREIAGQTTANALIQWIRGYCIEQEFLTSTPNAQGSITVGLDFLNLAGKILEMVEHLQGEFVGHIEGDKLKVSAGHVIFPDYTFYVPAYTKTLTSSDDGKGLTLEVTTSGATASWGVISTGLVNGTLYLPLCVVNRTGLKWWVEHWHVGAYVFAFPPAPFIAGYSASVMQSLDHTTDGSLVWTTYRQCNQQQQ